MPMYLLYLWLKHSPGGKIQKYHLKNIPLYPPFHYRKVKIPLKKSQERIIGHIDIPTKTDRYSP